MQLIYAAPMVLRAARQTTNITNPAVVAPIVPQGTTADGDNSWMTVSPPSSAYRINTYNRDNPISRQAALSQNTTVQPRTVVPTAPIQAPIIAVPDSDSINDIDSAISAISAID